MNRAGFDPGTRNRGFIPRGRWGDGGLDGHHLPLGYDNLSYSAECEQSRHDPARPAARPTAVPEPSHLPALHKITRRKAALRP